MRFLRCQRLTREGDYAVVREKGRQQDCAWFVLRFYKREEAATSESLPRLGIIASRRIGNAVVRNRAKRVFREIFRNTQESVPRGHDVVVLVRASFEKVKSDVLRQRFQDACARYTKHLKHKPEGTP